jgi:hypothetical protein
MRQFNVDRGDEAHQTTACRSLLASVISVAINDACTQPPKRDWKKIDLMPIHMDAFTAMRFLFDERFSGLNEYAAWLDFDAGSFRKRLMDLMFSEKSIRDGAYKDIQRRYFRMNYKAWVAIKDQDFLALMDDNDD